MPALRNGQSQFKTLCSKLRDLFHSCKPLHRSKASHFATLKPQLISSTNAPFDPWFDSKVLSTAEDESTIVSSDSTCNDGVKGDGCMADTESFLRDAAIVEVQGSLSADGGGSDHLSFSNDDVQSNLSEESIYSQQSIALEYHVAITTPLISVTFVNPPNHPLETHADDEAGRSYEFSIDVIGMSNRLGPFLRIPGSAKYKRAAKSSPAVSTHTLWTPPPVRVRSPYTRSTIILDRQPTSLSIDSYRYRGRARAAVPQVIAEDEPRVKRVSGEGLESGFYVHDIDTVVCCSAPRDSPLTAVAVDWEMGIG